MEFRRLPMNEFTHDPEHQPSHDEAYRKSLKPRMTLLPQRALYEVAMVMTKSAHKHGERGYETRTDYKSEIDACFRHINRFLTGEIYDPETARLSIAHAAARLLIATEMILAKTEK